MRIVTASTSVGPSPASARSRATRTASNIASGSLPSALTPGKPYAAARSTGLTANCWSSGVEYAYWLFSSTKITGSFCTPAQFMASWKSPREVEPSPNQVIAQRASSRSLNAIAMPVAAAGDAGGTAHVLGEDPVRLDAADDVRGEVAVQDAQAVLGGHRPGRSRRDGLLAEPVVEAAGDLALAIERHRSRFDAAHHQHRAQQAGAVLGGQVLGYVGR